MKIFHNSGQKKKHTQNQIKSNQQYRLPSLEEFSGFFSRLSYVPAFLDIIYIGTEVGRERKTWLSEEVVRKFRTWEGSKILGCSPSQESQSLESGIRVGVSTSSPPKALNFSTVGS